MLENLRSLAVFAKVAELGSMRAAARALSLSPSVVSHHLSELERRLALPLLYRSTRRLALTPDGEKLIGAAREMVEAAERGLDAVSAGSKAPIGTLRVTVPAFLAETAFCHDLAAFSEAHPRVTLSVSFTDAPRHLLRDGFDIALRAGRLGDSTTHRTRKLADMTRLLVAAPRYLGLRRRPRTPQDLETWDYIRLSSRPAEVTLIARSKTSARTRKKVTLAFEPRFSVDTAAAIHGIAVAGSGIATLPDVLVRPDLDAGRLVEVLPDWRPPLLGVYALWPSSAQRAGLTDRFLAFMAPRVAALFAGVG